MATVKPELYLTDEASIASDDNRSRGSAVHMIGTTGMSGYAMKRGITGEENDAQKTSHSKDADKMRGGKAFHGKVLSNALEVEEHSSRPC
jgi:hypothetical protein